MISHETKSKMASQTAQNALVKATEALIKIESHERASSFRWEEVSRRITYQGRLQFLLLGKILAVLVLLMVDKLS